MQEAQKNAILFQRVWALSVDLQQINFTAPLKKKISELAQTFFINQSFLSAFSAHFS